MIYCSWQNCHVRCRRVINYLVENVGTRNIKRWGLQAIRFSVWSFEKWVSQDIWWRRFTTGSEELDQWYRISKSGCVHPAIPDQQSHCPEKYQLQRRPDGVVLCAKDECRSSWTNTRDKGNRWWTFAYSTESWQHVKGREIRLRSNL